MARYYTGYRRAKRDIAAMGEAELLRLLDSLYGRPDPGDPYTLDGLRHAALMQMCEDWRIPPQHYGYYDAWETED